MARYLLVVAVALIGCVMGDDGYAAPAQSGYGAPAQSYGVPDAGYGAPAQEYGAPQYEPTAPSYASEEKDLFDFDKILELLPFFLAVFAAIIVAQLFAPLLGMLFDLKVGILSPLAGTKLTLINSLLSPLDLAICDISGAAPVVAGTARGFSASPDQISMLSNLVMSGIEGKNFSNCIQIL